MRVHTLLFAACGSMSLSAWVQVAAQNIPQATEIISVNDPRPIAMALEALEQKHGLAITYEDPEYTHPLDVQDVTNSVRKDGSSFPRVIGPRGGAFQFKYLTKGGKPQEDTKSLIRRMLSEYASGGGAVFDVQERASEGGTEWHVIPVKVRNKEGQFVEQTALLDNRVSIPSEKRSAIHTLSLVCDELSRVSGHHVGLGTVPQNPLYAYRVEMGATSEPARDVLAGVFKQLHIAMVWQLFYDPGEGGYALNLHFVARPSSTGSRSSASPSGTPSPSAAAPPAPRPRRLGYLPPAVLNHARYRPEGILEIQSALARGGYYQGAPSGKWDANTAAAMQKFQSANGLAPTGQPDFSSLQKLGLWPAGIHGPPAAP